MRVFKSYNHPDYHLNEFDVKMNLQGRGYDYNSFEGYGYGDGTDAGNGSGNSAHDNYTYCVQLIQYW